MDDGPSSGSRSGRRSPSQWCTSTSPSSDGQAMGAFRSWRRRLGNRGTAGGRGHQHGRLRLEQRRARSVPPPLPRGECLPSRPSGPEALALAVYCKRARSPCGHCGSQPPCAFGFSVSLSPHEGRGRIVPTGWRITPAGSVATRIGWLHPLTYGLMQCWEASAISVSTTGAVQIRAALPDKSVVRHTLQSGSPDTIPHWTRPPSWSWTKRG